MLVSTKKIQHSKYTVIKDNTYFQRGKYCLYITEEKGTSLEYICDMLFSKDDKQILLFENKYLKKIFVIFANSLENTIALDVTKKSFTWAKLSSVLKVSMAKNHLSKVFLLQDSDIKTSLIKEGVVVDTIDEKLFKKAKKRANILKRKKTYALNYITIIISFIMLYFAQNYLFERNIQKLNDERANTLTVLQNQKRDIKKEIHKYRVEIENIQSKKQVAKDMNQIFADAKKSNK
jgi:hypothetical protein